MNQDGKQPPSGQDTPADPEEPDVLPPETVEEFLLHAVEKSGLDEVVGILRGWHGRNKIKEALNKINHRDPIDRFTRIRRFAVELYAKKHGITPATLMVKLKGEGNGDNEKRSAREQLQNAREFVKLDRNDLIAAKALAENWGEKIPRGIDADMHLKKLHLKNDIFSPKPIPEV